MGNFCGLDFGTSNSSLGFFRNSHLSLTQFGAKTYTPSSIFFEFDVEAPHFGDVAIAKYIDGKEGRIIWSPKNALGTNLVHEKTHVSDKSLSFKDIIGLIIGNIVNASMAQSQQAFDAIVIGRPVHYNDRDQKLDDEAQNAMEEVLRHLGFKHIEFAYEPIAAAQFYAQQVVNEEVALIVDMGGGTSDFTILKLKDKNSTVLSIGGIHIAGTNFDRCLSLQSVMPELGMHAQYKTLEGKWATTPPTLHKDLATWHKIGFCYHKQNINYVKNKIYTSNEPHKFERLLQTLEHRLGHHVAIATERAKISLSSHRNVTYCSSDLSPALEIPITREAFEHAIKDDVEQIHKVLSQTIIDAQIAPSEITAVFMTGGASLVPLVRTTIMESLPNAQLIDGDKFGSVATGLTLIAEQKFG